MVGRRQPASRSACRIDQSTAPSSPAISSAFVSSSNFSNDMTCVTLARVSRSRLAMSALVTAPDWISASYFMALFRASAADFGNPVIHWSPRAFSSGGG